MPGDQRLVAYIVPTEGEDPSREILQGHLKKVLPDYMVPTTFMVLPALPLTPNGKLDRKALPSPDDVETAGPAVYEEPKTETEKAIAEVWQEVLRIERVGLTDNFFDLGGHSLLAVRVHDALVECLDDPPSLIDLFQYPTVSGLARHLSGSSDGSILIEAARERADRQLRAGR